MSFCAVNTILAFYPPGIKLNPLSCNRWTCPECIPKRRGRLKAEAFRGRPNAFITLTVNPEIGNDPSHRARNLVEAWRKVRRRAKKKWGNVRVPFIAVFEETKKGEPHLHILCRLKWIPQGWLSDQMKAEIGAPIVDIRRVESRKKVASYVAKYIGKNPEKYTGTKRYWRSLDWLIDPKREYKDPVGEASSRSFAFGRPWEIAKEYSPKLVWYQEIEVSDDIEYWLVWKPILLHKETGPPPQRDLWGEDRSAQEFRSGGV